MADSRRNRPHLYFREHGSRQGYTNPNRAQKKPLPQRDRVAHATQLRNALSAALAAGARLRGPDAAGVYLDFTFPLNTDGPGKLEAHKIELVTLRERNKELVATVFVPRSAERKLEKKIDQYEHEDTSPRQRGDRPPPAPRPKHEDLVACIDSVTHTLVKSLFSGKAEDYPGVGEKIWWEVWLRPGADPDLDQHFKDAGLIAGEDELVFPARTVRLVYGDTEAMGKLFVNSTAMAELRRKEDSPAIFMQWSNREQAEWAKDAARRIAPPISDVTAVTLLDTGVNRGHPMLAPLIRASDVAKYEPTWIDGDSHGHGTAMAGLALFGDLVPVLTGSGAIEVGHTVESVKILPDTGSNDDRLYGAITKESVARAQIGAPHRRRTICMAVTSSHQTDRGNPSAWSAAVDQVCHGDGDNPQLMLISAGNIRDSLTAREYPERNDVESVESPAQAWNAVCVGAFTQKVDLRDDDYSGWKVIAPDGDLCPTSRTSVSWKRQWPLKPEILMEGGNLAGQGELLERPDDLGILTTYRDPASRQFDVSGDTSAATALASRLAARLMTNLPERWPETIRGLMVHSARWTPAMEAKRRSATAESARLAFVRRYGYGVPDFDRALFSATDDLTLVFEERIQPFVQSGTTVKTNHLKLHRLPWPVELLQDLGPADVELRVTLSYFVEPNPGERGWLRRHRYASHGFRFDLKRPSETENAFLRRINKQAQSEEGDEFVGKAPPDEGWTLGRIRDVGSIHSDCWLGSAVDLASRSLIAVYPRAGWWKEYPAHRWHDRECRYSLIVSLAVPATVDIYTAIANPVPVETGSGL